jgi:hypothetical protein
MRQSDGPPAMLMELHRFGGTVRDADGEPVDAVWVAMPDSGLWTATDREGRFRLDRIQPGTHRVVVRSATGDEAEATAEIPGKPFEVVLGAKRRGGTRRKQA